MARKDPKVGTGKKPKGSGRRLYTDENPKDTVKIKYATVADARATARKVKNIKYKKDEKTGAKVVDKISLQEQIEILNFSDFLSIKPELLYKLNAGYTKWATDPNMTSTFYVPIENKIKYETSGQEYVQSQKINWISHDVSRGESLWALAKKYRTKIDIIRQVNQLESDILSIDQILLIPVGQASSNILIPFEAHVVSEGDTLWSLAKKFGVSEKKIMDINNIDNGSVLKIGQVLNIGNKNIFRNIESKKRTILYSVKQGDNLSKISKLFNVSIKTIRQDNDNLDIIRPGQILKITIKAF